VINSFLKEELVVKKLTIISENYQGVVISNGKFVKVLPAGEHFINDFMKEELKVYQETIIEEDEKGLMIVNGSGLQDQDITKIKLSNTYVVFRIKK